MFTMVLKWLSQGTLELVQGKGVGGARLNFTLDFGVSESGYLHSFHIQGFISHSGWCYSG